MSYIIAVHHPETGSTTSIGTDTKVDALLAAIDWLGGEITWLVEEDDSCEVIFD